ncbi:MAG: serine/threonine protein kinase [Nannocystaceae bacterium]|nr:serine/threonine protein kinase [Nannocystaceae bacterium]
MSEDDTPRDATDLAAGTVISFSKRFQIVGPLGEGGMGKVFKAFDPFMNRYVALKVMKTDVPESEQRRFRLEARLGGSFTHNNLVRVLDVGTTREHGLFWFAMEFLEGRDISDAVTGGRTVPLHVLCEIFRQVLDALRYVHLRGVVHRDIKPANIFVCRDPHDPELRVVKVLDFGVARDLNDARPDDPTLVLGDPRYMAPEQTRPSQPLDGRADLYALGMTFFEAVTGHHPFEDAFDEHPRELFRCHRERLPAMPSSYLPAETPAELAEAIDGFFMAACGKQPDERFADARVMRRAMGELMRFSDRRNG